MDKPVRFQSSSPAQTDVVNSKMAMRKIFAFYPRISPRSKRFFLIYSDHFHHLHHCLDSTSKPFLKLFPIFFSSLCSFSSSLCAFVVNLRLCENSHFLFNLKTLNPTPPLAILKLACIPPFIAYRIPNLIFSVKEENVMGNTKSNGDDVPRPEKSPNTTPHKPDRYCPYSLYIPMRPTSIINYQSNCSTMIWHWDKIAPYPKPLKKG